MLSIEKQCELLSVSRSSFYYKPLEESEENLNIMKAIDRIHTTFPFYGARRILVNLPKQTQPLNLKRIRRLMRLMQIEAIYQKPNLSKAHAEHKIYP